MTITHVMQRTRTIEGQPEVKDEAESITEGIFKQVGAGFEFAQRTLSVSMRRNGTLVTDPVLGMLAKVRPTYAISADGAITAISGFAEVEALVKSTMTPQMAESLAPVLSEEALVARERNEWNARYAEFSGAKLKVGEVITTEAPQALPNGETLLYTVRTAFPRWEACPAGYCVRIEQTYESDADVLAQLAANISRSVASAASAQSSASVSISKPGNRVTGSLSRLVDPSTMLIHSERVERTITMQMQIPGKGPTPVIQHEIRTYNHSYQLP